MKDYSNIVLSIITKNGEEYNLKSSTHDSKHVFAFLRLIEEMKCDKFNLKEYIKNNKMTITGFEISKYLSSLGNVVFVHTDVNNKF